MNIDNDHTAHLARQFGEISIRKWREYLFTLTHTHTYTQRIRVRVNEYEMAIKSQFHIQFRLPHNTYVNSTSYFWFLFPRFHEATAINASMIPIYRTIDK